MVPTARMAASDTSAGRQPWASTSQAESGRKMVLAKAGHQCHRGQRAHALAIEPDSNDGKGGLVQHRRQTTPIAAHSA